MTYKWSHHIFRAIQLCKQDFLQIGYLWILDQVRLPLVSRSVEKRDDETPLFSWGLIPSTWDHFRLVFETQSKQLINREQCCSSLQFQWGGVTERNIWEGNFVFVPATLRELGVWPVVLVWEDSPPCRIRILSPTLGRNSAEVASSLQFQWGRVTEREILFSSRQHWRSLMCDEGPVLLVWEDSPPYGLRIPSSTLERFCRSWLELAVSIMGRGDWEESFFVVQAAFLHHWRR